MLVSDALHTNTERTHTALLSKRLYSPTDSSDVPTDSTDSTDSATDFTDIPNDSTDSATDSADSPTDSTDSPTDFTDSTDSTDSDPSPALEVAQDGRAPIKACSIMRGAVMHPQVVRSSTLPGHTVRPRTVSSA